MAHLQTAPLHELHPTQLTVGMIEVKDKKHHLRKLDRDGLRRLLEENPIPVVTGPQGKRYLVDRHHFGRAALDAGVTEAFVVAQADLSSLSGDRFWDEMDARGWVHPLDAHGVRHVYSAIPHHLGDLVDDVYRSLARYVRAAGGYEKTSTAFAEFVWADFFRRLVAIETVTSDFEAAVRRGAELARGEAARGLPGHRGP